VPRIGFLRRILEEGPEEGLDPVPHTGFHQLLQKGLDDITLPELIGPAPGEESWTPARPQHPTAGQPHQYYLSYMGLNQAREVKVAVPPGERYSATLIDIWGMTETRIADSVERGEVLIIPPKPHQALLLRRVD